MFKKILGILIILECNLTFAATQILICKLEIRREFKQNENSATQTERFNADVTAEIYTSGKIIRIKISQGEKILAFANYDTNDESYLRFNSKNESDENKWIVSNESVDHKNNHRISDETSVFIDRRTGVMSFHRKALIDYITKISDFGNGVCNKTDTSKHKF